MEQTAFHPGEHLQEELNALGMSPDVMAERLRVAPERLRALLGGQDRMDAELAMRLGHFFGISATFWLNLQVLFDLEVAQREYGEAIEALPTLQAA